MTADESSSEPEKSRAQLLAATREVAEFDYSAALEKVRSLDLGAANGWLIYATDCIEYCKQLVPLVVDAGPLGLVQEATNVVGHVLSTLREFQKASARELANTQRGDRNAQTILSALGVCLPTSPT